MGQSKRLGGYPGSTATFDIGLPMNHKAYIHVI